MKGESILFVHTCTYIPTKVCKTCRIIKQLIEFNKEKRNKDGYKNQCKNCIKNKEEEHYELIKDEINQYDINKNKTCNKFNQIKCIIEFYKDKTKYDGYHTICKICSENNSKEYYKQNKDEISDYKKT